MLLRGNERSTCVKNIPRKATDRCKGAGAYFVRGGGSSGGASNRRETEDFWSSSEGKRGEVRYFLEYFSLA